LVGTNAPTSLLEARQDQNAGTQFFLTNDTAGTAAVSQVWVRSNASSIQLSSYSASFTTANQYVADSGLIEANSSSQLGISALGAVPIVMYTNSAERMRIDASGNFSIGTTSNLNTANFQISTNSGDGTAPYVAIFNTGSTPTSASSTRLDFGFQSGASNYVATNTVLGRINFMGQGNDAGYGGAAIHADVTTGGNATRSAHAVDLIFETMAAGTVGDEERMRITSSGKVGIGNTAPTTNLEISQSAGTPTLMVSTWSTTDGESSQLSFQKSSSATINTKAVTANNESLGDISVYGIDTNANQRRAAQIKFEQDAASTGSKVAGRIIFKTSSNGTNDVEHVRIQSNGYIGIGTTSADAKVHIEKDTNAFFFGMNIENPNAGSSAATGLYLNCGGKTLDLRVKNALSGNVGYINSSGTLYTSINHDGGVCLVAKGGNVGIGTTSPGVRLDVRGVGNTSQNFFEIKDSDGAGQLLVASDSGGDCYLQVHDTNGAAKVVIHGGGITYFNGGNFGIGTATPGSYKLYVNGNTWVEGSLETSGQLKAGTSLAIGSSGSGGYTFPATDGTNGYVLKTNGSGTVAWAADSGGGGTVTSVATSGAITGGTITTTGTITHSTSPGYKHVPTGGSSKQYLKYSSSGTAVWSTVAWEDLPDISTLTTLP